MRNPVLVAAIFLVVSGAQAAELRIISAGAVQEVVPGMA
jgi:hypothetical protein